MVGHFGRERGQNPAGSGVLLGLKENPSSYIAFALSRTARAAEVVIGEQYQDGDKDGMARRTPKKVVVGRR